MNIELKPIAESKVRQLGGDVCGVLVRKDGKLAAVDEHGRVQWLQSERGSEPVAWSWEYRGLHVSADKAFIEKIAADGFAVRPLVFADTQPARAQGGEHWAKSNPGRADQYRAEALAARDVLGLGSEDSEDVSPSDIRNVVNAMRLPVYAQPQPAQQGSTHAPTDDRVQRAMQMPLKELATKFIEATDRASRNMDALKAAQPAVPEEWREVLAGCVTCFNYPEWSDKCEEYERRARELLSTPTTPQADGWVRCEDRLPTYRDSDEYGDVWAMSKLYGVKKMSWSSVRADFESHWMPTGLKRPQPPQEGA